MSVFSQQLIQQYGGVTDYRFSSIKQLKTATTLSGTAFASVLRFEPWEEESIKPLLDLHPVAVWSELSMKLAPRAGIFGRMCTFYGGWSAAGAPTPKSVADMMRLNGAVGITYGGTGDPGTIATQITCAFDHTMQDILKSPYGDTVRPVFFYCFIENSVLSTAADADRFMISFTGKFHVHGRY